MKAYDKLHQKLTELADISSAIALMHWDQEVHMPHGGGSRRARQIATLAGLQHHKFIQETKEILEEAEQESTAGLNEVEQANLREVRREFDKFAKLPNIFVMQLSQAGSEAQMAWEKAKKAKDFSLFQAPLEKLVELKKEEAGYYGYDHDPYDALIDTYERGMTAAKVREMFSQLRPVLDEVLDKIRAAGQVDDSFLGQLVPENAQWDWGVDVIKTLGFDFEHGRQDRSTHPFTISFSSEDVRITTKVVENDIREMLYSSIHEAGHGMYEQGLPVAQYGLPGGEACSLSIHESQSRIWENNVGREIHFWNHFFPSFASLYADKLRDKGAEEVFKAVNKVQPSLIRISSDELTYHYHILLRFEIEHSLINGEIEVKDLPSVWNAKMKEYFGLEVPDVSMGVLQDIHWSHGSFGYFPTYSLGSFYAAQFYDAAMKAHPGMEEEFANGNFDMLKSWLNDQIFSKGKLFTAEELCRQVSGEPLNVNYFINYIRDKFSRVYGISL